MATKEFEARYQKARDELGWLYMELYNSEYHYDALIKNIANMQEGRSADLKKLDEQREKTPDWFRSNKMLGVTMYTELFAGNLKGLTQKLDYLSQQGITYLHLMPLLKMPHPNNDGGYAVEDFRTVDPKLGTNEDLADLTAALRKRGISLCMDFVINHTADTHEWAMRAKAGDPEYMARYHCYETDDIPKQYERTVPQVFPTTAPGNFTWCPEMHRHVLTTFNRYQWDLNWSNPVVFNEMVYNILFLANLGVEVMRIDAVPYIWKQLGTNCRNLPQVHTIMRMIRIITELVCPAMILKGEVVMAPSELPAYFGTPDKPECHMLYGVSSMVNLWAALAARDARLLKSQLDALNSLPANCWFVNYLRCHDDIGWGLDEAAERSMGIDPQLHKEYLYHFYDGSFPGSFARGEQYNYDPVTRDARSCGTTASLCGVEKGGFEEDEEQVKWGIQRDLLLHAACMSLKGFTMLSSGDEIGQVNDYSYKDDPAKSHDSRFLHRSIFSWEHAANRTKNGTVQEQVWDGLAQMEAIRRAEPCFAPDVEVSTWDTGFKPVLAIRRFMETEKGPRELLCLFNFSEEPQTVSMPCLDGKHIDYFTGDTVWPGALPMGPWQYRWCIEPAPVQAKKPASVKAPAPKTAKTTPAKVKETAVKATPKVKASK